MLLCQVSHSEIVLSKEIILTWATTVTDVNKHHTKKEYIKILEDGKYEINYEINWKSSESTTQPLQVTVYKVKSNYEMVELHNHVTVCTGNFIRLKDKLPFELNRNDRICIGAKNFSTVNFLLSNGQLSLTKL
jgi:hypothetical protein